MHCYKEIIHKKYVVGMWDARTNYYVKIQMFLIILTTGNQFF